MTAAFEREILLASEDETRRFAENLSLWAKPGQLILLTGDLGSGKSVFARAFVKALALPGRDFDVPSPTFTLVQTYQETRLPVFHADLYRLQSASEILELGLDEMLETHIGIVEWAERLPHTIAADALAIELAGSGNQRTARLRAKGNWVTALERDRLIQAFLDDSFAAGIRRQFLEGDASARRYEILHDKKIGNPLLMDMPTRPDGPPVRGGKPYSAIAHLAEGITAVVAINNHLVAMGYSAPRIFKTDLAKGLALIENLGEQVYGNMMREGRDMTEPHRAAVALLADMSQRHWPASVAADPDNIHTLKPYDDEALLIETNLLVSWFWPYLHGSPVSPTLEREFEAIWRTVLPLTRQPRPQWVLRDFHSPNLLWLPDRNGIGRVGLIDTQDAVLGHGAYDLVSLTQDARVDVSPATADALRDYYLELRTGEAGFSAADFTTAYAALGAQRCTKILGIFARLSRRDGKHGYIKHMPRVSRYLARNLEHPALAELKRWYVENLPQALAVPE